MKMHSMMLDDYVYTQIRFMGEFGTLNYALKSLFVIWVQIGVMALILS